MLAFPSRAPVWGAPPSFFPYAYDELTHHFATLGR